MNDFTNWNLNELCHFGIRGMKWGQRRFQNEDGSLTALGEQRYGTNGKRGSLGRSLDLNKLDRERARSQSKANYLKAVATDRYNRQTYRAQKKGLSTPSMDERTQKLLTKSKKFQELANKSEKMANRIIENSLGKKMSVISKTILRQGFNDVEGGTHYRVKNNGLGARAHKQRDVERMKTRYNRARRRAAFTAGYSWGRNMG